MGKSVQNKKQSIDSLARIVADMGMLYQIVQSIEECPICLCNNWLFLDDD